MIFEGVSVYYRKSSNPEVVVLSVFGDTFDCVLIAD